MADAPRRYPRAYEDAINDDPDDYYAWSLRRARAKGGRTYAEDLLHGFCSAIEQKREIPAPILEYLYAAFAAFLSGERQLPDALLLSTPRGRPKASKPIRTRRGRLVTPVIATALLNILIKRGRLKTAALDLLEEKGIAPRRSLERWDSENSLLAEFTTSALRQLIRDERETAKLELSAKNQD